MNNEGIEKHQLSNGIEVLFQNTDSKVAATYWWINAGSADESASEAGYAHFLEHMLFKDAAAKEQGTGSTGQTAQEIESLGGDINAYTTYDQTAYHVTCAALHWVNILKTFLAMARPQKFLELDFQREREVILEEYRKNQDSASRKLFEELFALSFHEHPYRRSVIGTVDSLKAATVKKLTHFYQKHYIPQNMGLIFVGPLNPAIKKQILQLAEKHLGKSQLKRPAKVQKIRKPVEPELQPRSVWKCQHFHVETPTAVLGFRVPDVNHPDMAGLDVLAGILGMGESCRLYQSLFYQKAIVTDVSCGMYIPKDPGLLYITFDTDKVEKGEACLEAIYEELQKIKQHPPTIDELTRVITNIESEKIYAQQTVDGIAGRIGFLHFVTANPKFETQYLAALRQVTPEMVQLLAQKYFDYQRLSGSLLVPKASPLFKPSALQKQAKLALSPQKLKPIKTAKPAGPQFWKLPSGTQVIYHYRPTGVFSVHTSLLGGTRLETVSNVGSHFGISNLLSQVWTKGSKNYSNEQIIAATESRAAQIDGFSGRNSCGLQLTGLKRDFETLTALFCDTLLRPVFPADQVGHAQRQVYDSIQGIQERSSSVCSELFLNTLFQTHPYGKSVLGTHESVAQISAQHLSKLHQTWLEQHPLVLSLSGDVDQKRLEAFLNLLDTQLLEFRSQNPADPARIHAQLSPESPLDQNRRAQKDLKREQTHIIIGGLGLKMHDPRRFVMNCWEALLGGQSGRLFIELREKQSLAYTVSPLHFEGIEPGFMGIYIACAPAKVQQATEGIAQVVSDLAKKGPTKSELERAKQFYLGRMAMDLQSDQSLSAYYSLNSLYNLPIYSDEELKKQIGKVQPEAISKICRDFLVDAYLTTAIVG
jgi:zinc protease